VSVVLLVFGVVIIGRYLHTRRNGSAAPRPEPVALRRRWLLTPLGLFGGFLDASGGGGWGPVTTSTLLAAGKMKPRTVIGTVSGSEFIVSVAASIGFLLALGAAGIRWDMVAMILLGGVIAAPLSAYLVRWFDERALGTAVGGLLILLNVDRVLMLLGLDSSVGFAVRAAVVVLSVVVVGWLLVRGRAGRESDRAAAGMAA
jgi:uncharacterized membrane protein YfcA